MRRTFLRGLARSTRRAALLTTLCLALALGVGVGGFAASSQPSQALASALAGAPSAPAASATGMAAARGGHTPAADGAGLAIPDLAFELSRAPITEAPAATEDVVRAARLVTASTPTPALRAGDRIKVSVSFYYCEMGASSPSRGDGGGFCGAMRDGSVVYNGAAACDYVYLGQRFRIEGDPLGRVYRCADTGSAVHGLHRDIWFGSSDEGWQWQRTVGQTATIEILP